MIKFFPFYKDMPVSKKYNVKLQRRIGKIDYRHHMKMLHDTFTKFNPEHEFIAQTDKTTKLPYNTFRTDLSNINLMESIVKSNLNLINNHVGKSVLVGVDHLIANSIDLFFEDDFDIGIYLKYPPVEKTYLNVNNSVVLVNSSNKNHQHICDFFTERYNIYKKYSTKNKDWWGDQLSLYTILEQKGIVDKFYKSKGENRFYDYNKNIRIKIFTPGEHLVFMRNDNWIKNSTDIVLDFPGDTRVKKFTKNVYQQIMEL